MRKINISTIDGSHSFDFPYEWIESSGLTPILNDLEAKAERGITTGYLFRVRQAEIPSMSLKINKCITQAEAFPMLRVLREVKFKLTYFEKYDNAFKHNILMHVPTAARHMEYRAVKHIRRS